jgi:hypothetical protein
MIHAFSIHAFEQFVKDQEQLVGLDDSNSKVIITVFGIVEMKPPSFPSISNKATICSILAFGK